METTILPSLPAQSFTEISRLLEQLGDATTEIQIDLVDGHFAPTYSWPFTESDPRFALDKLKSITTAYAVEVDCMLMHPEQYLDLFAELKVARVIIHYGSTEQYEAIFAHQKKHSYELGIAITNDTPLPAIKPVLDQVNVIQVMGITAIGSQGQPFDERTIATVSALRQQFPEAVIAVDGSVNATTIERLQAAGANRFAPGSAVSQATDPAAAMKALVDLVAHT